MIAKISLSRVGTQSEGKEPRYQYLSSGLRLISCWKETLSILDIFPTTPNLSTETKDLRSPNTMSSVTCSRGEE